MPPLEFRPSVGCLPLALSTLFARKSVDLMEAGHMVLEGLKGFPIIPFATNTAAVFGCWVHRLGGPYHHGMFLFLQVTDIHTMLVKVVTAVPTYSDICHRA